MKKQFFFMIICAMLLVSLTSCSSIDEIYKSTMSSISSAGKSSIDQSEINRDINKKYAAYASLDVYISGKLKDALNFYFMRFGDGEDISIPKNTNLNPGIFLQVKTKELEEYFSYSSKKPSLDKADNSVKTLYPKLNKLIESLSDADLYYKMESYIDDNFAKGKTLHKNICSQYQAVKPLIEDFHSAYQDIFIKKCKEDLEKYQKNDCMIKYYTLSTMLKAQDLETELHNQKITSNNIKNLDISKFKERYTSLSENINKLLQYSNDQKMVEKEGLGQDFMYGSIFKTHISDVKAAATNIMIRAQNEKQPNGNSSETAYDKDFGTPEYYSQKVTAIILDYVNIMSSSI